MTPKHYKAILVLFLIISGISLVLFSSEERTSAPLQKITGAVIHSEHAAIHYNPLKIAPMEEQQLRVGQIFELSFSPVTDLKFHDNSDLFRISQEGVIRFVPTTRDTGRRSAIIIIEDKQGNFDSKRIIFNIKDE